MFNTYIFIVRKPIRAKTEGDLVKMILRLVTNSVPMSRIYTMGNLIDGGGYVFDLKIQRLQVENTSLVTILETF